MIWKEVVGHGMVHMTVNRHHTQGHVRCTDRSGKTWDTSEHKCWDIGYQRLGLSIGDADADDMTAGYSSPLPLLKSCRQMFTAPVRKYENIADKGIAIPK